MKASLIVIIVISLCSCKKKSEAVDPIKPEDKAKATALQLFIKQKKLSLVKYYSESPIDYIDTDQVVKSETQLWSYVSAWIPDDKYTFLTNGEVQVEQNAVKIPIDNSPVFSKLYSVNADAEGVAFAFLGHEYQYLKYHLISYSDTALIVHAKWNGKTVISEYKITP
jgi:hypothetical protein